ARLEAVRAEPFERIGDDDAEIGHEVRDAADVLGQQPAVLVDERTAEVADLVDHHVVRALLQVERHLVGDGRQRVADRLDGDGIGGRHACAPVVSIWMSIAPSGPTTATSPSPMTRVLAYSSMTAGPVTWWPTGSCSRW